MRYAVLVFVIIAYVAGLVAVKNAWKNKNVFDTFGSYVFIFLHGIVIATAIVIGFGYLCFNYW